MNTTNLIRWAGLAAMGAGIIFAGIQPIHPPDVLASVTTTSWAVIIAAKFGMCLLFLLGITGLYARQVEAAGRLGLAGFLLLSLSWWVQTGYVFAELFILPVLATAAPQFVESFLGIVNQHPGDMDIGALPAVYNIGTGGTYLLGGLLFGIATVRANVLPRWPAGLLAVAAAVTPLAALLPHAIQRFAAVPMGLALAWLGYTLWSERRAHATQAIAGRGSPRLGRTGADS
ncbi:MAG TPA: hypothetical protein VNL77_22655 [Roseiflexaceae bacterium]|nr:hypothetical protein [Roseiflexaceae bacterium]